jgi:hypothetical protein
MTRLILEQTGSGVRWPIGASGDPLPIFLRNGKSAPMSLYSPVLPEYFSASRQVLKDDVGNMLTGIGGTASTLTVTAPIPAGWHCTVIQGGSGQITMAGGAGVTLRNQAGEYKTGGQYATVGLYAFVDNEIIVSGATGP